MSPTSDRSLSWLHGTNIIRRRRTDLGGTNRSRLEHNAASSFLTVLSVDHSSPLAPDHQFHQGNSHLHTSVSSQVSSDVVASHLRMRIYRWADHNGLMSRFETSTAKDLVPLVLVNILGLMSVSSILPTICLPIAHSQLLPHADSTTIVSNS